LHGGTASCESVTSDYYGKFARSWSYGPTPETRLQDWLDPDATGTLELDGLDASGIGFSGLPLAGDVPLDVQFEGSSALPVDNWIWDFGDGDSAFVQSPLHTYTGPGVYNVSLLIISGTDTLDRTQTNYVIALADTLGGPDTAVTQPGQLVVTVNAKNTVPLRELMIPVEYGGNVTLQYDGFSTDGCRTSAFATQEPVHENPAGQQVTIRLENAPVVPPVPNMPAGEGPVLKLYFTITGGLPDDTTVIDLSGYSTRLPYFSGPLLTYEPTIASPVVTYLKCCIGTRGDVNGNGTENVSDLSALVDFMFRGGPEPNCFDEADIDGSGAITVSDISYFVDFLFRGGPTPPPCP
jgi:PKD repeat protein